MMDILETIKSWFSFKRKSKDVALVLGGGGARGIAHIGGIEVLEERGYNITSVAGTSMGALVGGMYAGGKLKELKDIILGLDKKQILSIMDISLGLDHVASGKRLMKILDTFIGDTKIEDLNIKFCCCASDVVSGDEKVFKDGLLKTAIRASISVPCFFKPVYDDENHIYVDGSVHNTLPLNRVDRTPKDILIAIDVNAPDNTPFDAYVKKKRDDNTTMRTLHSIFSFIKPDLSENYMNMAIRVAHISIQANSKLALQLNPPDILAELPMSSFGLFDFSQANEIYQYGRDEMTRKLDEYENK
jgi:NTE family protein